MNNRLLNRLLNDEKKVDRSLYSSGPYWDYKNKKAVYQLKKNGLKNFRGLSSGVGTSYADNLVYDFRNELNLKGRLVSAFFDLPLIKKVFQGQLSVTSGHINNYLKNLSIVYKNDETVKNLIAKYKFDRSVEFGCVKKFELGNHIKKLFVCSGPGSYTALRVGIAFMYGLSISKNLPLLNMSCFDLLKLGTNKSFHKKTLYLVYSSNNQCFASIFSEEKKCYILKKVEEKLQYSDIESIRFKYSVSNFSLSNNISRIINNENHKIMHIEDIIKKN